MKIKPHQLVGFALVIGGSIAMAAALATFFKIGSCGSGVSFQAAQPCPAGTGKNFAELFGGIVAVTIGIPLSGAFALTFGGMFAGVGGYAVYNALSHPHLAGRDGALIMGFTFLAIGVPTLLLGIGSALSDARAPKRAPIDLSTISAGAGLTAATAGIGLGSTRPIMPMPAVTVTPPNGGAGVVTANSGGDALDKLKELADLKDRGVLNETEFETQKAKLLG